MYWLTAAFHLEKESTMKKNDKEKNITILGKETVFDGVLQFNDVLHIQGSFFGAIDSTGFLLIEKNSVCKTEYIKAESIIIEGTVYGTLTAADRIEMKTGSAVYGDITAARIKIADGVAFEGAVNMIKDASFVENSLFSMQSEQLKEKLRDAE